MAKRKDNAPRTSVDEAPDTQELFEQSRAEAIEIGGRENGVDLLHHVALILNGDLPLSPVLADWFSQAVDRIGNGEDAGAVFGTKSKRGPDPLASRQERLARDQDILERLEAAQRDGLNTSCSSCRESMFERVARETGHSAATVRDAHYAWETVEHFEFPPPSPEDIERAHQPLSEGEQDAARQIIAAMLVKKAE
ncbi:MAG: hypothetical protein K9L88_03255 [Chromatiaceae bacterium]|nr:hypothetical protein [Chromatiaceae bacterium]MCF8014297.1 hypothetical protein [Chromatiaceae bacterium]